MTHTETLSPATVQEGRGPLDRLLFALAVIALALAPTQLTFKDLGGPLAKIPLAPAELILVLAAVVWAVRWLRMRDTSNLPPVAHWLLIGATALGVFALGKELQPSVAKEVVQLVLYLIVGVTIFRAVLTSAARMRIAVIALLATTSLAVLLGVVQRARLPHDYQEDPAKRVVFADNNDRRPDDDKLPEGTPRVMGVWRGQEFTACSRAVAYVTAQTPACVNSTFGYWGDHGYYPSRTAYAGFLALVLPFALALLIAERKRRGMLAWMGLFIAGAAFSLLAGFVGPAILAGLLVTGIVIGPRAGRGVLLGILGYGVIVLLVGGFTRTEMLQEPFSLRISATEAKYRYPDEQIRHLKKFWGEQQAALNLFRSSPLLGVGAGEYQAQMGGGAYGNFGAIDEQRLEPDMQSGYLLTLASMGLVGLAALLTLFGSYLSKAQHRLRLSRGDPWTAALLGSLAALIVLSFVTFPFVRGSIMVIVFVFAALCNPATFTPVTRMVTKKEEPSCE